MAGAQGTATLGVAVKTETRCKICKSPHRGEIEDLLALRSDGKSLTQPDGTEQRVTEDYIFSIAQERWGFKLNRPNISGHFSKHFQKGDPSALAASGQAQQAELARRIKNGEVDHKTPDEVLDLIIDLGAERIALNPDSITNDHLLKAIAEKTKRKTDESRDKMLEVVGASIAVADKALDTVPKPPPPIVDVEVVGELVSG